MKKAKLLWARKSFILLLFIACFSAVYRVVLVLREGFPPGADIGLHDSLIHSITQGGSTNFMWNYYHMGGGNSNTFPGYHIFVSFVIFFTGLPDYLAEVFVAVLFSSLIVLVAFLITRKVLNESIGLIVAFLVGISYYDIYILLWSGYPNVITLMLIPLTFYVLLEKSRFSRLPRLTVASLLSAGIFLTHSLSSVMFIMLIFALVFVALCFPRLARVERKDVLDWLMGVVDLDQEIGDRELQLVRPQPARRIARYEVEAWAEIEQDVRGLANQEPSGLEKRRRERRALDISSFEEPLHRRYAAAFRFRHQRDIDVVRAGVLERKAHVLAATLDAGPVVELVDHRLPHSGDGEAGPRPIGRPPNARRRVVHCKLSDPPSRPFCDARRCAVPDDRRLDARGRHRIGRRPAGEASRAADLQTSGRRATDALRARAHRRAR